MVDVSITVPERDLIEFRRIMGYLQTKLGKTPDKAVEMAAVFVAKALQAATVTSPKVRKVVQNKLTGNGKQSQILPWLVVDDRDKARILYIPAKGTWTKEQVQSQKIAQIRQHGLSKLLWWKALASISTPQAGHHPTTSGGMDRIAERLMKVSRQTGEDASIGMNNSSRFAMLAFRSSGRATVDNAMRRAANNMRKYVERQSGEAIAQRGLA